MVSYQYPQYLYALSHEDSYQDDNGNWTSETDNWELVGTCREETNGKGNMISKVGGDLITFSSLIQIPKGTLRIPEGTTILVSRNKIEDLMLVNQAFIENGLLTGEIVAKGICLKYDFGRLHCRLWI